jgi:hypothetical protein
VHSRVPVVVRVLLQGREKDREQLVPVLCHEVHNVLIVPQEQGALCYLNTHREQISRTGEGDVTVAVVNPTKKEKVISW